MKEWWNKERKGRVEEGTSQDYCPTNGGLVMYVGFWSGVSLIILLMAL